MSITRLTRWLPVALLVAGCGNISPTLATVAATPAPTNSAVRPTATAGPPTATPEPAATADPAMAEADVFVAVLEHLYSLPAPFVVAEQSYVGFASTYQYDSEPLYEEMPDVRPETLADFLAANADFPPLPDSLRGDPRFALIDRDEYIDEGGCGEGICADLEAVQRDFPGAPGIFLFSRIGFDTEMTQALVKVGLDEGSVDGTDYVVLLEYDTGRWVVADQIEMYWIS
jgi:hypothetical protein